MVSFRNPDESILRGSTNIVICAGDMKELISLIPKHSLKQIWINFPEPPAWHERSNDSQSDMITPSVIEQIDRTIKSDGELFIVSDNATYMRTLFDRFQSISHLKLEMTTSKSTKCSYFDRMFAKGGKSERYILQGKKA